MSSCAAEEELAPLDLLDDLLDILERIVEDDFEQEGLWEFDL